MALEKHGRFISGGREVGTFALSYHNLRRSGLPFATSLTTAVLSHVLFSRKTQKNMTQEERQHFKPGFFDIFMPRLSDAQGPSNTGVYAKKDLPDGTKRGDINREEFDRIFREFAVGRDYLTAYDLVRMREANMDREEGSWFKRLFGRIASKRQFDQLLTVYADRVVYEEEKFSTLVPAISREQLFAFYQGGLQYDIVEQREGSNLMDQGEAAQAVMETLPGGELTLAGLMSMKTQDLEDLYSRSGPGSVPDGKSLGMASLAPGTWLGRVSRLFFSLFWRGKVFNREKGELVNRLLIGDRVKAKVFIGQSWFDKKPAIIIDYQGSSWLAAPIRDEIRQVSPSLYLGFAYLRMPGTPRRVLLLPFALDFSQP
jgi:hypothetical protein